MLKKATEIKQEFQIQCDSQRTMERISSPSDDDQWFLMHSDLASLFYRVSLPAAGFALILVIVNLILWSTGSVISPSLFEAALGLQTVSPEMMFLF